MSRVQPETGKPLIDHVERFLGPISKGWKNDHAGVALPYAVMLFEATPFRDAVAFVTLGLSNFPMGKSSDGKPIRLELMVLARKGAGLPVPDALQRISNEMLARKKPVLRGEVIGPFGPLWDGTQLEAFYVTAPAYLPDEFATVDLKIGATAILAWLVPITRAEADRVREVGWSQFEDELVAVDPDLLDPYRSSFVSAGSSGPTPIK